MKPLTFPGGRVDVSRFKAAHPYDRTPTTLMSRLFGFEVMRPKRRQLSEWLVLPKAVKA